MILTEQEQRCYRLALHQLFHLILAPRLESHASHELEDTLTSRTYL